MSISDRNLTLIFCGVIGLAIICLSKYSHFIQRYRNDMSILPINIPITTPNTVIDNNFEEEKAPDDNNLYNVNV